MIVLDVVVYSAVVVVAALSAALSFRLYAEAPPNMKTPMSHMFLAVSFLSVAALGFTVLRLGAVYPELPQNLAEAVAMVGVVASMAFFLAVSMDVHEGRL